MVLDKKLLDELIELHKAANRLSYRQADAMRETFGKCYEKAREIDVRCGVHWIGIDNFVRSVTMPGGLCRDADNEGIYGALKALGWEVAE